MPPKSLKPIIEKCFYGDLGEVYEDLVSQKYERNSSNNLNIIIAICKRCNEFLSKPEKVDEGALKQLLGEVLAGIEDLDDEQFDTYIRSAFYIVKLFVQINGDFLTDSIRLLLPPFAPKTLTDKHQSVYKNIIGSFYNIIARAATDKDYQKVSSLQKISFLVAKLSYKLYNLTDFFEKIHKCCSALIILEGDLLDLYTFSLDLISQIDQISSYYLFIKYFSVVYSSFLKRGDLESASKTYRKNVKTLGRLFKGEEFDLLSDILSVVDWMGHTSERSPKELHTSLKMYQKIYGSCTNLQTVADCVLSATFMFLQLWKKESQKWFDKMAHHQTLYDFLYDLALIIQDEGRNLSGALRLLDIIGGLGRLTIVNKEVSKDYKLDLLRCFETYSDYVKILKSQNSDKWKGFWYDLVVHLYTIGVHLTAKDNFFVVYLRKFVQMSYELEGFKAVVVDPCYVSTALDLVCDHYTKSGNYKKALFFISLSIIFSKTNSKSATNRWILTKISARESKAPDCLQEATVLSILKQNPDELNMWFPRNGLVLDVEHQIELLELELRSYKERWKSKVPMSCVLKEINELATVEKTAQVFVDIWERATLQVHESVPEILQSIIKKLAKKKPSVVLAHLYFLQHKYQVIETVLKHCEEMERTLSSVTTLTPVGTDPNDICDLISSYDGLKLGHYLKMMKNLDKSLDLAHDYCNNPSDQLFTLVKDIGHEYSLHGQLTKSLEAWELAYKVAFQKHQKLEAISFLIEMSDVSKPYIQQLVREAETYLLDLKGFTETVLMYHLCKADAFLYVDFETSYASFKKLLELKNQIKLSSVLEAKLLLLEHKFMTLPCDYGVPGHEEFSLVKIHLACHKAAACYKDNQSDAYAMRVFFEVYEGLARMYTELQLPLLVRCYAKNTVLLAQKMLLPFRTLTLLYYLALADISCRRFDDAEVKIVDLSDMLGVGGKTKSVSKNKELPKKFLDKRIDELSVDFNELVLDVPNRLPSVSGSPTFQAEGFKLPFYFQHQDCHCFYCGSLEYQVFILRGIFLNGWLYACQGNNAVSDDYFSGCLSIYKNTKTKQSEYNKTLTKRLTKDLVPDVTTHMLETYCLSLVKWSYSFTSRGSTNAEHVNRRALKTLEPFKSKYIHLHYEALAQKINLLMLNQHKSPPKAPTVHNVGAVAKTPQSKQTKIYISPKSQTQYFDPPTTHTYFKKALTFDLSDDEELKTPAKTTQGFKTPAPSTSKLKIYTDEKTKKKGVLTEVKQVNGNPILASRTKLLTEKLRSSSRKPKEEGKEGRAKDDVRKNLLSQLNEAENSEKTVRRSGRNRK